MTTSKSTRRRAPASVPARVAQELSSSDIDLLDERALVDTVNYLIREEAIRLQLPADAIVLTSNEKAPDGGIDAKLDNRGVASDWFPSGKSIWQFKAYVVSASEIKKDLTDPKHKDLQDLLKAGAHYVLVMGRDLGTKRAKREEAIAEGLKAIGATGTGRMLTSVEVASWASRYPAILLRPQFHLPGAELLRHEEWAAMSSHLGQFLPTTDQTRVIAGLRDELQGVHHGSGKPRLTGLSGLGKTRSVLEATRPTEIAGRVLYASGPDLVPMTLLAWLRRTPGARAVLVIDNCDGLRRQEIEQQLATNSPDVFLVTIGPESSTPIAEEGFYNLQRMSEEDLKKIIESLFRGLQLETQLYVARLASGFVKAAIMLGQYFQRGASLPPAVAADNEDMRQFLEGLIGSGAPDENRMALTALSLFTELGVENGLESELECAVGFLKLDLGKTKRAIENGRKREIVETVGRRRRVTPEILAILLAAELWGAQASELVAFYEGLPDVELRKRFLRRLASLGQDDRTSRVVAKLLGSDSVFTSLVDLNAKERAELLLYLASAHPEAGLEALQRLIGAAALDELRRLNGGRRAVVATLERLVWLPSTFEGAARLLLNLAEAENERYANNATGVWKQLFRPLLSGSAVSAEARLEFLERVLFSGGESMARRRLALEALADVFGTHVSRSVVMDSLGGRPLPREWRPATQTELRNALTFAFGLLERAIDDPAKDLAPAATEVLLANLRSIFLQGLGEAVLARLRVLQLTQSPDTLARVAKELGSVIAYDTDRMPEGLADDVRHLRDELLAASVDVRLRRLLGKPGPEDYKDSENAPDRQAGEALALADQCWGDRPVLEANWNWLMSAEAQRSWSFFVRLGELDVDSSLLDRVQSLIALDSVSTGGRPIFQWAAMLAGATQGGRRSQAWARLEELAKSSDTADAVLEAIWRGEPTNEAADLVTLMVTNKVLKPNALGLLVYGNWIGRVGSEPARRLIVELLATGEPDADEVALHLLGMRLGSSRSEHASFAKEIWRALEGTTTGTRDVMTTHYWSRLASPLVAVDAARVARLLLRAFRSDQYVSSNDERLPLLRDAAENDPQGVWSALTEALTDDAINVFALRDTLRGQLVESVPSEVVIAWVRANGEAAAVEVMELLETRSALSGLQRSLLIAFPTSKALRSALLANMYSGTFSGSHSGWLEQRLEWVQSWAHDAEPSIRKWASALLPDLEKQLASTRLREQEEGY